METTENKFVNWILLQLEKHNWSYRELSRRSGISHSHISNILNGARLPSWDFCAEMSRVFNLPVWDAFLMSGLVSKIPDNIILSEKTKVLLTIFSQLPPNAQDDVLDYINWQIHKNKSLAP